MRWTVSYRNGDGASGKTSLDADNRAGVIAMMRERGCTVLNIEEEMNKKPKKSNVGGVVKTTVTILLLFLILTVVGYSIGRYVYKNDKEIRLKVRDTIKPASNIKINFVK